MQLSGLATTALLVLLVYQNAPPTRQTHDRSSGHVRFHAGQFCDAYSSFCLPISADSVTAALRPKAESQYFAMNCDMDEWVCSFVFMRLSQQGDMENQVELEEKTRLINQVLELQHTLEVMHRHSNGSHLPPSRSSLQDLSARVDAVKEENLKLKSENQVLGQYIENLMSASSVFQTTDTKSKRK
ncbi:hypothetical protein P4O66_013894 [Electrophorus voltai]|uniref:Short coiled-coil protein n=1 Tax=Electrophorus voltai TaxID=2609070 RepID=A0AAD8Z5X2_9TELE|nr:hypothetical protein P4O66_013894 [Electrophorus voltai]